MNLRPEDDLSALESALTKALVSRRELEINQWEVDIVPFRAPADFQPKTARIDVDLWVHPARTPEAFQDLAERLARVFKQTAGSDRAVKVVVRPYDVESGGWSHQ